jgi:hypothetical protein
VFPTPRLECTEDPQLVIMLKEQDDGVNTASGWGDRRRESQSANGDALDRFTAEAIARRRDVADLLRAVRELLSQNM